MEPFISVDDLEAWLGTTFVDPNALEVKISLDSACQIVRTYLGQTINYVEDDVEIHSGGGRKKLRLRERPVRSVTSVVIDGDTVDPSEYSVRGAVITMLEAWWWFGNDNVAITYSHGYDLAEPSTVNVPSDIRLVALNVAARVYNAVGADATAGAIISETIGDYSYQLSEAAVTAVSSVSQLVAGEQFTLDPYRIELVGDSPTH